MIFIVSISLFFQHFFFYFEPLSKTELLHTEVEDMAGAAGGEEEAVPEHLALPGDGDQPVLQVELPALSHVTRPVAPAVVSVLALPHLHHLHSEDQPVNITQHLLHLTSPACTGDCRPPC